MRSCQFLLVEDDDELADRIVAGLQETECLMIRRVRSESEALQLISRFGTDGSRRPDIVLVDCRLDCQKLLEAIRQTPEWADIPVIVLASSPGDVSKDKLYRLYANSFLVQPSDPDEFHAMMRDVGRYWGRWNELPRA